MHPTLAPGGVFGYTFFNLKKKPQNAIFALFEVFTFWRFSSVLRPQNFGTCLFSQNMLLLTEIEGFLPLLAFTLCTRGDIISGGLLGGVLFGE